MKYNEHTTDEQRNSKMSSNPPEQSQELHEKHIRNHEHHTAQKTPRSVERVPNARPNKKSTIDDQSQTEAYRETIEQVQKELPRSTRGFSRFIHAPAIERTSDIIATTIARPNALMAGGIAAFVLVLGVYSYAKYTGFTLQGSETIITFVLGWSVGVIFDIIRRIFTQNRD